jgi:hypothetical protein
MGHAAPEWICVGAGLVPAVATVIALRHLLLGRRPVRAESG